MQSKRQDAKIRRAKGEGTSSESEHEGGGEGDGKGESGEDNDGARTSLEDIFLRRVVSNIPAVISINHRPDPWPRRRRGAAVRERAGARGRRGRKVR